jgi:hypothetical protein
MRGRWRGAVDLDDPGIHERAEDRDRASGEGEPTRGGSWLSNTSARTWPNTSPPRPMTLISIAAVSFSCGTSGSGAAAMSRSYDPSPQLTTPVGAFLRTIFLRLAGSSPAFASATAFSISHSGAMTTTLP